MSHQFQCAKLDFPPDIQTGAGKWSFHPCYWTPAECAMEGIPDGHFYITPSTRWRDVSDQQHDLLLSGEDITVDHKMPVGLVHTCERPTKRPWSKNMRDRARLVYVSCTQTGGVINGLSFTAFYHNHIGDIINAGDFFHRARPMAVCSVNNLKKIQFNEEFYDENADGSTDWNTPLERVLKRIASKHMYTFNPVGAAEVLGDWYRDRKKPEASGPTTSCSG